MDYPCAKFGDFGLSLLGFIVQTDRQTHTDRITDADDRYTDETICIGSSADRKNTPE